ncbi:hypothetical protein P153DRAFT_220296 [Dothidotthia symphoricarpi CBS 119687]|uniref:Uncharacterized protein n=1 Tax=Dothidotthia symphoricarpi CBS 119687 TaxID=1392245 RepID=A0A6A6AI33_9PLEO|nr:uncharacterized protein P153DRAFT_220296 [Dothidotthia symphoricarpi CBS 119687]KAF2130534.1 hypothetical protein P153DRAFT_220296 [Dothidotthia symphoricarpi CBS 119687]
MQQQTYVLTIYPLNTQNTHTNPKTSRRTQIPTTTSVTHPIPTRKPQQHQQNLARDPPKLQQQQRKARFDKKQKQKRFRNGELNPGLPGAIVSDESGVSHAPY